MCIQEAGQAFGMLQRGLLAVYTAGYEPYRPCGLRLESLELPCESHLSDYNSFLRF
jgi:hypothetical protein